MTDKSETQRLAAGVEALGQSMTDKQLAQLVGLLDELERWNRRINLTAVRDREQMLPLHLFDSLAVRPYLNGRRVLDVGTGPGFPGLPLAVAEPEREFVLLDSNDKKVQFVDHAAASLGLGNVTAVRARAEDFAPGERFDTVIARAVAELATLADIAGHHVREDGVFVAQKGRYPAKELEQLSGHWGYTVAALSVPGLEDGSRHLVLMTPGDRRQR
ncbi:MAG: 16S rRNA (guanine(527)-N(7))-methyltransferase RsmG [Pseudomonadota bacterium]